VNNSRVSELGAVDIFSQRIRWLTVAVGLSATVLFFFLTPFAALGPATPVLGAALQPRLPDMAKRVVKWLIWVWAFGWSSGSVLLAFLFLTDTGLHHDRQFMMRALSSLSVVSVLLVLWWDVELIVDGLRRIRTWRSSPPQEPRAIGTGVWIFSVSLNIWIGWGLVRTLGEYHGFADLYTFALAFVEAAAVLVFDILLVSRTVKLKRVRRGDVRG
jgi:hypothetical protein